MKTDKVNKKKIKVDLYLKGTKGNRSLIVKDKKGVEYNVYTIGWGIPVSLVIETEKETKADEKREKDRLHKEVIEIRRKNEEEENNKLSNKIRRKLHL